MMDPDKAPTLEEAAQRIEAQKVRNEKAEMERLLERAKAMEELAELDAGLIW